MQYKRDSASFAISADARAARDIGEFERARTEVQVLNRQLYYLEIIEQHPTIVLTALLNVSRQGIPGCCTVKFERTLADKVVLLSLEFSDTSGKTEFDTGVSIVNVSSDPKDAVVGDMLRSKSSAQLLQNVRVAQRYYSTRRADAMRVLRRATGEGQALMFLDLLYFSTVTITTLGYGDIIPTSTGACFLVMAESLSGVAYIAFALAFLWPEPKRDLRDAPKEPPE